MFLEALVQVLGKYSCAGTGENLAAARAPGYLDTPKGRVALVAACDTMRVGGAKAVDQRPDMKGKPGVNLLAVSREYTVDHQAFAELTRIGAAMGFGAAARGSDAEGVYRFGLGCLADDHPRGRSVRPDDHPGRTGSRGQPEVDPRGAHHGGLGAVQLPQRLPRRGVRRSGRPRRGARARGDRRGGGRVHRARLPLGQRHRAVPGEADLLQPGGLHSSERHGGAPARERLRAVRARSRRDPRRVLRRAQRHADPRAGCEGGLLADGGGDRAVAGPPLERDPPHPRRPRDGPAARAARPSDAGGAAARGRDPRAVRAHVRSLRHQDRDRGRLRYHRGGLTAPAAARIGG